ncbi:hypothetical protein Pcinc_009660 [Petrolisthes cinctipes]|uniref:Uncharacterized protein n=1 Tax=Petrolisthes cinctipes TaxID=88211 RepID=A0AAE1GAP4_PETCI|nr:hypothetical protein Pcinc_009660 [Petrolisthes cinctipes]
MSWRCASVLLLLVARMSYADLREPVDDFIISQVNPNNIKDNLRIEQENSRKRTEKRIQRHQRNLGAVPVGQYPCHRYLTQRPHVAGTKAEMENAMWVADRWREQGWDQVHLVPYQVLLSYPKNDTPNLVSVLDESGVEMWTSQGWQDPLYAPEEFSSEILPNFNAFSAPGQVEVLYHILWTKNRVSETMFVSSRLESSCF